MNAMDAFRSEPRRALSPAQEQATERATARAAQRTAARSIERASDRHALRDIERDQAESPEAQRRAVGSEFSALLALLAGTEAPVRPDPAKHGLETIGIPIEPLRARDEDASNEDAVSAQAGALELAARSRWGSPPGAGSQISESALDSHVGQPTDRAAAVSGPPGQRQTPGNEAAIQRTQTRDAILRASSRGAASVEQLRARRLQGRRCPRRARCAPGTGWHPSGRTTGRARHHDEHERQSPEWSQRRLVARPA